MTPCTNWVGDLNHGVNRALGMGTGTCTSAPVAGSQYYDATTEAGVYSSGECAHCHEPHASFGNTPAPYDPPPNTGGDAGPDPYLLMKEYGAATNYSSLCWYCHNNMTIAPSTTVGNGMFV